MTRRSRAYSLTEIMLIVVILGAVAAVVVPQFAGASDDERTARAEVVISGIRNAIDVYARKARQRGAAAPAPRSVGRDGAWEPRRAGAARRPTAAITGRG